MNMKIKNFNFAKRGDFTHLLHVFLNLSIYKSADFQAIGVYPNLRYWLSISQQVFKSVAFYFQKWSRYRSLNLRS